MSVHLLRGDSDVILGEAVSELVRQLVGDADRSLALEDFDGDDYALGTAVDAARTPPFLTDRRIVVVRGIQRFSDTAPLLAYLAEPLPTTDLVLTTTGSASPRRCSTP